ncbi:MAG: TlpA family protein disulfide reductase [Cohaesibacter sp.]|nr:TlpA family protein disulfide reductase [Cohaesibacter sp.]MCV6603112.1 TlpA family protein disulfide reductase [Cohaesibacter sp.]
MSSPTTPKPQSAVPKRSHDHRFGQILARASQKLATASLAVYVILGASGNAQSAEHCTASKSLAQTIKPMVGGAIAALQISPRPGDMRQLAFKNPDGKDITIEDFRGKAILLNLWATWCPPCKKEMPDLDELQAKLGSDKFEVVAVNIDRKGPEKAKAFLDEIKTKHLALYSDKSMQIFHDLRKKGLAFGMPTTLVLDKEGCALGYMAGPANWADQTAITLLEAVIKGDAE